MPLESKRLIIQIGRQQPNAVENKKKSPKMLKAINDHKLTVEDLLFDLLWKDIGVEQLGYLFEDENEIVTGNNLAATVTLSLGPNRSLQIEVAKDENGMKYTKLLRKEDANGNKRKRRQNFPKSLKVQLVTSELGILLCPREPIYQLIDSKDEVILQSTEEGSWEYLEIASTTPRGGVGENVDAPSPAENQSPREESRPSKRRKIQKQSLEPQQQEYIANSTNKRRKTKVQEKKKGMIENHRLDDEDCSESKNDPHRSEQEEADHETCVNQKPKATGKINNLGETSNDKHEGINDRGGGDDADFGKETKNSSSNPEANTTKNEMRPKQIVDLKPIDKQKVKVNKVGTNDVNKRSKTPNEKDNNQRMKVNKKGIDETKHSQAFSDRDVFMGVGKAIRQNPGNVHYNKYVQSKSHEYADDLNKQRTVDGIKSNFRFYRKEKGSESWTLLGNSTKVVSSKIKRDLLNHLNRRKESEDSKGTQSNEQQKVVEEKATETNQTKQESSQDTDEKNIDNSSSQESDEEGDDESDEDSAAAECTDGGSLSDETAQTKEKEEEGDEKNITIEKSDERFEDQPLGNDESDGDDDDDSSRSSSSMSESSASSSSSTSVKSDGEMEIKTRSESGSDENSLESDSKSVKDNASTASDNDNNSDHDDSPSADENKNGSNDLEAIEKQEEKKSNGGKITQITPTTKKVGNSENDSDGDSSTSSSDISSTSSSSVSSSSDEDSSSSDSDDSSVGIKKRKSAKLPTEVCAKRTPNKSSSQNQHQQQSARRHKRKPLLDPKQPLVFLETNR